MGLSSPVASRVNGDSVVVTMVVVVVANLFVHVVNDEGGREGGAYLCNAVLMVVVVFVVLLSLTFNAAATLFFLARSPCLPACLAPLARSPCLALLGGSGWLLPVGSNGVKPRKESAAIFPVRVPATHGLFCCVNFEFEFAPKKKCKLADFERAP